MKSYRGAVQIGEGVTPEAVGLRRDVSISDLDSSEWFIDFPAGWIDKDARSPMTMRIRLLEGERSGQIAWADLWINALDGSARMEGRNAFGTEGHGSGPPSRKQD